MDGLINLYKPRGITSAKALYRVRKIVEERKSGHAGTLDPMAEGVLLLCLGKATKLVERIMDWPKTYRTIARLDLTSASFDAEGETQPVQVAEPPSQEAVERVLAGFVGVIEQVPPAISALKVGGRPAYKLSRSGRPPELAARPVQIHALRLLRYAWPELEFEVCCGRGTYVRALIRDIGRRLGTGGCLTSLLRAAVGPFTSERAWTIVKLEELADPTSAVVGLEELRQLIVGYRS